MQEPWKISGRLGNWMFQFATLYALAKKQNVDYYFQDPKWFEEYALDIKALYGDASHQGLELIDKVSLHVRRGDYVNNPFYVDLTKTDYYQRAMAEFPDRKFLVFSDDIRWCEQQEIFKNCEFAYRNELEDLNLMMRCDGHIIANSTFSWWGAWLGRGKVVAPKLWYADGVERTKCPETWVKL